MPVAWPCPSAMWASVPDHSPASPSRNLATILLEAGVVTLAQLEYAHVWQSQTGRSIGETLVEMKVVTEEDIGGALARQLGLPFVDVRPEITDRDLIRTFPATLLRRFQVIPLVRDERCVSMALADPTHATALEAMERAAGCPLILSVATPSAIRRALDEVLGERSQTRPRPARATNLSGVDVEWDRSGATFLVFQVSEARKSGASEIHFIPASGEMRIYHRVGETLVLRASEPENVVYSLLTRLEALNGPTIEGQQVHAAGQIVCPMGKDEVPLDVSLFSSDDGISVTLELRSQPQMGTPSLEQLGLEPTHLSQIRAVLDSSAGLVIVSGPPRAGCSTTLACMLADLDSLARRIIAFQTRSGPQALGSRITLDAVDARRLWPEIATAQSADVVALDDVLFGETVGEALASAAAGRLLLVRTDWTDSFGLLDHLFTRPGNRHLLADRLHLIIQQRVVRVAPERGDEHCAFGSRRRALFEVLMVSEAMRHGIRTGQTAESLRATASKEGFRTLADEANRWVTASILSEAAAARLIS